MPWKYRAIRWNPFSKRALLITGAAVGFSALLPGPAADAANPRVMAEKTTRYQRIMFEWPQDISIAARVDGKRLAITFDQRADYDFSALRNTLGPTLESASLAPDGRTVILILDQPYRIRTFTSDRMAGVDLMEALPEEKAAPVKSEPKSAEKPATKPAKITLKKAETIEYTTKDAVSAPTKPTAKETTHTTLPPADITPLLEEKAVAKEPKKSIAAEPKTPPAAKPEKKEPPATVVYSTKPEAKENTAPPHALSPSAGETTAEKQEKELKPIAATPKPAPEVKEAPPVAASALPVPAIASAEPAPNENILIIVPSMNNEGGILRFTFPERTACAVFQRAGNLWMIFSRSANVNLDLLENQLPNQTGPAERIDNPNATIIRLPFDGEAGATVTKDDSKFVWQIALFSRPQITQRALPISVNTEPPLKPNVTVSALQVADPITVQDPLVGDELIITPFYNAGEGIAPGRQFVDFDLLRSVQGLVVRKVADDASVILVRNGVRITTRDGARISPNLPTLETIAAPKDARETTLLPYSKWKLGKDEFFDHKLRTLFREMALSKTPQENAEKKLEIAGLYLGQGMGAEALGMIQNLRKTDPSFYVSHKINALSGVANFLMYRFADAAQDFSALELNGSKEVEFWRTLTAELLGAANKHFDFLAAYPDYIKNYPPVLRQRLTILAADRSIAGRDYNRALKIMDTLDSPEVLDPVKAYANFLLGKISAGTDQPDAATEVWKELAGNYSNPFVRASAEFSLVVQQLQAGKMEKDEVIQRLERLRIAWRGDGLELGVLLFLGNLYAERKDYAQALDAWRDVVSVFPNTTHATAVGRRMKEAFNQLFLQGEADKLPPLEALALYYEYRDLTPKGAEGDEIIHLLADKLMDVDLLDQATLLLEQQMRSRQEKAERSLTGAKLAQVYLLNHQPQKALDILEQSNYGDNPEDVRLKRDRLAAEALAETGRARAAIDLIENDQSTDAQYLRIHIFWKLKDWPNLIASAETLLKNRSEPTAELSPKEIDCLLKLATAYVFEHDYVQLSYLRDYFGPQMSTTPQKDVFNYLTRHEVTPSPETFDQAMQQMDATKSFLESYSTRTKN